MHRISRRRALGMFVSAAGAAGLGTVGGARLLYADDEEQGEAPFINGRVVAVGIPGASAVSPVGTFLPGGPVHDNPALAAFTQPGRVLDATRILVGGRSNFGAPRANSGQSEGSFLSLHPGGAETLTVPAAFAGAGD